MPQTIFIVFGHSITNPAESAFLGAYSSKERAQRFIDAQREARRERLSLSPVVLDEPPPDEFWSKPGEPRLTVDRAMAALSRRLNRRQHDHARRVNRTVDTPAPIIEAVRNASMDPKHDHLNELLEPDPLDPGPCVCGHPFYEHHQAETFASGPLKWVAFECDYYEYDKENRGWPHCGRYTPASGESPERD